MINENEMTMTFDSIAKNEAFARTSVAVFISQLNPTMNELNDIKTAVSEAVTNAIIHGYENKREKVYIKCTTKNNYVYITIKDSGIGISDIEKAMTPLYTSKPEMERSGMGFTVMQTFMDEVEVISEKGSGTTVNMIKKISHH